MPVAARTEGASRAWREEIGNNFALGRYFNDALVMSKDKHCIAARRAIAATHKGGKHALGRSPLK